MLAVSGYSLLKFNSFLPPHGGLFHCSNLSRCTGEGMIRPAAPSVLWFLSLLLCSSGTVDVITIIGSLHSHSGRAAGGLQKCVT